MHVFHSTINIENAWAGRIIMNAAATLVMSSVCFVIGAASWFLPARRYYINLPLGGFAMLFVVVGLILMTVFKWEEVAVEISGLKLQLSKAEEKAAGLTGELSVARFQLAQVEAASERIAQERSTAKLATAVTDRLISEAAVPPESSAMVRTAIKEAISNDKLWVFDGDPSAIETANQPPALKPDVNG
jgi:hypothetical protein